MHASSAARPHLAVKPNELYPRMVTCGRPMEQKGGKSQRKEIGVRDKQTVREKYLKGRERGKREKEEGKRER